MADYNNQLPVISTSIMNLWDDSGRQFRVSGNDTGLSIAIWSPTTAPDGSRRYPTELRHSCMLIPRNTTIINEGIINDILPAYEKGKDAQLFVFTNAAKTTMFGVEVKEGVFYAHLYRDCNPTTHVPTMTTTFTFGTAMAITTFNTSDGELDAKPVQADFFLFAKAIRGYDEMLSGSIAGHGARVSSRFQSGEFMNYLRAIATKIGAQLPTQNYQNSGGGYGNRPNSGYNSESTSPTAAPPVQMQEVSDLADLLG